MSALGTFLILSAFVAASGAFAVTPRHEFRVP